MIAAAVAYATVKYVAMPHQDAYAAVMDRFLPMQVRSIYDPLRDRAQTLMGLSALSGYFVMAVCICSTLDAYPKLTNSFKVQGHKNYFTASEWLQATGVALVNLFVFNWFATLPVFWLQRDVLYGKAGHDVDLLIWHRHKPCALPPPPAEPSPSVASSPVCLAPRRLLRQRACTL